MPDQTSGQTNEYRSKFKLASGPGYWHASFVASVDQPFREMDLSVSLRGEPVSRFWPYAIKIDGRSFSFNFKDMETNDVFPGPGDDVELKCVLFYKP